MEKNKECVHLMWSSILKTNIFLELLTIFHLLFLPPSFYLFIILESFLTCTFKLVDLSSMSLGLSLILFHFITSGHSSLRKISLRFNFILCLSLKLSQYTIWGHSVLSLTGWVNIRIVWYCFHTSEQIVLLSFLGMFVILFSLSLLSFFISMIINLF